MNKSLLKIAEQYEKSIEGEELEEKLEDIDDFVDPTEGNIPPAKSSSSKGIPTSSFWKRLKEDLNKQTTGVSEFQKTCALVDVFEKVAIFDEMEEEKDAADAFTGFGGKDWPNERFPVDVDKLEPVEDDMSNSIDETQIVEDIINGIESISGVTLSQEDVLDFIHNITEKYIEEEDFQKEFEEEFESDELPDELPEDITASLSYQFMTKIAAEMDEPLSDENEERLKRKIENLILDTIQNMDLKKVWKETLHGAKAPDASYPLAQNVGTTPEDFTIASVANKYMKKLAEEGFDPLAEEGQLMDSEIPLSKPTNVLENIKNETPSNELETLPSPTSLTNQDLLKSIDIFDKKSEDLSPVTSFEDEDEDEE